MPTNQFIEKLNTEVYFEMIHVEGGSFMMGGQDDEVNDDEKPLHKVILPGFYIGQFPVTQSVWKAVIGQESNPSWFKGDDLPVETISWNDTRDFLEKLNAVTGKKYRLLSESEWEYAARGRSKTPGV